MKTLKLNQTVIHKASLRSEQEDMLSLKVIPVIQELQQLVAIDPNEENEVYLIENGDDLNGQLDDFISKHPTAKFYLINKSEIEALEKTSTDTAVAVAIADEKTGGDPALVLSIPPQKKPLNCSDHCETFWDYLKLLGLGIAMIIETGLGSASLPIFIAVMMQNAKSDENLSLTEKQIMISILWTAFALINITIPVYLYGKRFISGKKEKSLSRISGNEDDGPGVINIYLNSLLEFINGFLMGFAIDPKPETPSAIISSVSAGLGLGALNWLIFMLSDAQATWRTYMEDRKIKPIAKQYGMEWFYNKADLIAQCLREIYPPAMAAFTAYCVYTYFLVIAQECEANDEQQHSLQIFLDILTPFVAMCSAFALNNFDIRYMFEGLNENKSEDAKLDHRSCLLRAEFAYKLHWPLKLLGKFIHGEIISDVIHYCGGGKDAVTNFVIPFNVVSHWATTTREMGTFISSSNAKVGLSKFCFFNSAEEAARAAKSVFPIELSLSVFPGLFIPWSRSKKVRNAAGAYLGAPETPALETPAPDTPLLQLSQHNTPRRLPPPLAHSQSHRRLEI